MIHRASMGNFTAPSMKPGGTNPFFPLVYCSSSDTHAPRLVPRGGLRRRHQQLRRAGGSLCTPHAAARTPSTCHPPLSYLRLAARARRQRLYGRLRYRAQAAAPSARTRRPRSPSPHAGERYRPLCSATPPQRSCLTSSFSPALAAAVPLGSRARRLPRAQTQQMAAAQPERDE
jgi:hypothetical protein